MKQLTCEMCDSTNFAKQDGFFVCQDCGMKYSVADAKKMMRGEEAEETNLAVQTPAPAPAAKPAKIDNLMALAVSSYESKNYSQAEEFCNQIIALDSNHYEAWKLKGKAINYQISAKNPRITEVYNCIMTSYRVLDAAEQADKRDEVLEDLRECLEGEIDFVMDLFKSNRPKDAQLKRVKDSFVNCASNVVSSYKELGFSHEETEDYKTYIINYFIKKANKLAASTWDDVVYYNYYRGGFTEEYRPDNDILRTYLDEGNNVLNLLLFAESYFDEDTPLSEKRENYRLQKFMHGKLIDCRSYKRMVSTTTNGYGAVISRREYWEVDQSPTANAIAFRNKEIAKLTQKVDAVELEMAKADPNFKANTIKKLRNEQAGLNLSPSYSGGYIAGTIICGLLTWFMYWLFTSVFDLGGVWGIIMIVVFGFITLMVLIAGFGDKKQRGMNAQNRYDALQKKIDDMEKA